MSLTIDGPVHTGAPQRSTQQRMEALTRANEIRTRRAQLKRDLKAGRADVRPLIADPPEYLETMKLFDLVLAMPKLGRTKVNKLFATARISPSKTIGGLSERQRIAALHGLGEVSSHYRRSFARS